MESPSDPIKSHCVALWETGVPQGALLDPTLPITLLQCSREAATWLRADNNHFQASLAGGSFHKSCILVIIIPIN